MINTEQLYRQIKSQWKSVYPIYFDSTKSISEGRRVSIDLSVPSPNIEEVSRAVGMCKIKNIMEPHRAYPRDILYRGRLKAEVFDKNKKPIHEHIASKKVFLREVAKNLKIIRNEVKK